MVKGNVQQNRENDNNKHFLSTFMVVLGERRNSLDFFNSFFFKFFFHNSQPHSFVCNNNSYFGKFVIHHPAHHFASELS